MMPINSMAMVYIYKSVAFKTLFSGWGSTWGPIRRTPLLTAAAAGAPHSSRRGLGPVPRRGGAYRVGIAATCPGAWHWCVGPGGGKECVVGRERGVLEKRRRPPGPHNKP